MRLVFNNLNRSFLKILNLKDFENIQETFKKFSTLKEPFEAKIFAINESINIHQLSKFKKNFDKFNFVSLSIYSNNRYTVLAGKSLKIDSTFVQEQEVKNQLFLLNSKEKDHILHEGTVRSGERISSNGNLCIIGDVNPGAIVSANKNIYVWGKLLGVASAGKGGNDNAYIASLYLNPLQLRISNVVAIGPKDKPKNYYPEIAVIENDEIIIKPYLIENKK